MKVLGIGDLHVTVDAIEECRALIGKACSTIREEKTDYVVFSGDQHHNHGIVNVEVVEFWKWALDQIWEALHSLDHFSDPAKRIFMIRGNHDMPGYDDATAHALLSYSEEECVVVNEPHALHGILLLPYYPKREDFIQACKDNEQYSGVCYTRAVWCHQSFYGGTYENGVPILAEDGIDPDVIPQQKIISGHIHKPQEFGKVLYLGSPRWRTRSDANTPRFLYVLEFSEHEEDQIRVVKKVPTEDVCRPIYRYDLTPNDPDYTNGWNIPNGKVYVDVSGPADFVQKAAEWLKKNHPSVIVRTNPDRGATIIVRESEGIAKAFGTFLKKYQAKYGTDCQVLAQMVKERINVNVL